MRIDPGLLAGRRVHGLDGLHDRARDRRCSAGSSRARRPRARRSGSSSARSAWYTASSGALAKRRSPTGAGGIPFIIERGVLHRRLSRCGTASSSRRTTAKAKEAAKEHRQWFTSRCGRDWVTDRADVRHRRHDERRLLPDVHVRDGAPAPRKRARGTFDSGSFSARRTSAVLFRRARVEAVRRMVVRQARAPASLMLDDPGRRDAALFYPALRLMMYRLADARVRVRGSSCSRCRSAWLSASRARCSSRSFRCARASPR